MHIKKQYVLQPYQVGPKDRKSLVITIPAALSKKYKIDLDTIFILRPLDNDIIKLNIMNDSSETIANDEDSITVTGQ